MQVAFRTDASLQLGSGHVMRCLTLADALRARGCECRFVGSDEPGNLLALIRRRGHATLPLPAGLGWQDDAQHTLAVLGSGPVDWLIVDHYSLDARWEQALRGACQRLLAIDDLADRAHDCDLLLDQNLVADMERRYDGLVPGHCGTMLGPHYALLQPEYATMRAGVVPRTGHVRRLLIYFGGADLDNLTGRAVAATISLGRSDVAVDVVVGISSPHIDALRAQLRAHPNFTLHTALPSLAPLIAKADLAIGGSGATTWERCCLGLPGIVITLAANQVPIAAELDRRGLVRWLGHHDAVTEEQLARSLAALLSDPLPSSWSEQCSRIVDGQGAGRVSVTLNLQATTPLRARPAQLEDEQLILQWANDPLARRHAFNTQAIEPATHREWFRQRLRDLDRCHLYVVETLDGLPVGQTRFDRRGAEWEISYALDACARGRGLGRALLQTALHALRANVAEGELLGRVKPSNQASRRIFETLGFAAAASSDAEIVYRRAL